MLPPLLSFFLISIIFATIFWLLSTIDLLFLVTPRILQHLDTSNTFCLLLQFLRCGFSFGDIRLACQESAHFPCTPVSIAVWVKDIVSLPLLHA